MFTLPGPRRYFSVVTQSLEWGKHVILVMPSSVSQYGITTFLIQILNDRYLGSLTEIDLKEATPDSLYSTLAEGISCSERLPSSINELLQFDQCKSRFALIKNGYDGDSEKSHRFTYLLKQSGEISQTIDDTNIQLIVIAKPTDPLPDRNLKLDIHPWWGVLGQLDVDIAVDDHLLMFPTRGTAEELWLRSVCKGVARGNPELAKKIIESSPENLDEINNILDSFSSGYIADNTNGCGLRRKNSMHYNTPPNPPINVHEKLLWENSAISWIRGYGHVLHLESLSRELRNSIIKQHIWSGEAELLIPIIESVRLDILQWITLKYGEDWIEKFYKQYPSIDKEAILSEIGPLSYALKISANNKKFNIPHHIIRTTENWRKIRNELAHSNYVDLESIQKAVDMYIQMSNNY